MGRTKFSFDHNVFFCSFFFFDRQQSKKKLPFILLVAMPESHLVQSLLPPSISFIKKCFVRVLEESFSEKHLLSVRFRCYCSRPHVS